MDGSNEYRYNGQGSFSFIQNYTEGEINVNKSNTAYNQMKGNTISMYGRYGMNNHMSIKCSGSGITSITTEWLSQQKQL